MPTIPTAAAHKLALNLEHAEGRSAKAAIRKEFCEMYGITDSTLSRWLHSVGFIERRRADKGVRRIDVTDEELLKITSIRRGSHSERKGQIMPANRTIQIAEDSGLLEPGVLTPSGLNRFLRERGLTKQDQLRPEPHVTMKTDWPNEVHQMDFSLAVNWKMFQGRWQYQRWVYKNKEIPAGVPRLWRALVVDHASGIFFPYYIQAVGEDIPSTVEALYFAWAAKTLRGRPVADKYPFRGVPQMLIADRGPGNNSEIMRNLMQRLGVRYELAQQARAKGSVEKGHDLWESQFESGMRLQTPETVEQLNEWALDFAIHHCATAVFRRYQRTRSDFFTWTLANPNAPKILELNCSFAVFKNLAISEPVRRRVSGEKTISFEGRTYRMPPELPIYSYVQVHYSAFEYPRLLVRAESDLNAAPWACDPIVFNHAGFPVDAPHLGREFKSHKKTATRQFVEDADKWVAEQAETRSLRVFGHHAEKVGPLQVQPQGVDALDVGQGPSPLLPKYDARVRVSELVGRGLSVAEAAYVNTMFGPEVTEEEIEAAMEAILRGVAAPVLTFPHAAGGEV